MEPETGRLPLHEAAAHCEVSIANASLRQRCPRESVLTRIGGRERLRCKNPCMQRSFPSSRTQEGKGVSLEVVQLVLANYPEAASINDKKGHKPCVCAHPALQAELGAGTHAPAAREEHSALPASSSEAAAAARHPCVALQHDTCHTHVSLCTRRLHGVGPRSFCSVLPTAPYGMSLV